MIKNGFVKIKTFWESKDRNIDSLSLIYKDELLLQESILELTKEQLNIGSIQGKRILLNPNWVKHQSREEDKFCLTTEEAFILALIKVLLKYSPSQITIGDAPIQGCNWGKLISDNFLQKVDSLSKQSNIDIFIKDFRRVQFDPSSNEKKQNLESLDKYLIFDLGKDSYLEPITTPGRSNFRVTQYDPDRFNESHTVGMHKYCITKELFEADVVISLPKVKTHQKAGLTAALKNIVGLNGDKDYLPHHRIGGTKMGGDSYPGKNYLRYLAELCYDKSYKNQGGYFYKPWVRLGSVFWRLSFPSREHQLGAAWHGNDTTWRMVMDLNKIVIFGKADGTLGDKPQRFLFSLSDGIIGGQGNGPLQPDALPLGIIAFSNDSPWHDLCMAELMQIDSKKVPLLQAARQFMPNRKIDLAINNNSCTINEFKKYSLEAKPPPGWEKHLKK